jgi:hypothetical protein
MLIVCSILIPTSKKEKRYLEVDVMFPTTNTLLPLCSKTSARARKWFDCFFGTSFEPFDLVLNLSSGVPKYSSGLVIFSSLIFRAFFGFSRGIYFPFSKQDLSESFFTKCPFALLVGERQTARISLIVVLCLLSSFGPTFLKKSRCVEASYHLHSSHRCTSFFSLISVFFSRELESVFLPDESFLVLTHLFNSNHYARVREYPRI